MFERYTEKARRVIFFARYEASQIGSPYIETEHLLLGLLREDKTMANRFLRSQAALESIRKQIEAHTTMREKVSTSVDLPLSHVCKRVLAYARFNNAPVTVATAREALKDLLAVISRQVSIENIQKTVADYYKIKVSDMYSKKRYRSIARPRQVAMALAKELTQQSLPEIGEAFGGRDHTTVLHACRKTAELRETDQEFARDYAQLQQILLG